MPVGVYVRTQKCREALSKSRKGFTPWNKGKKIDKNLYPNYGHHKKHTETTKQLMSSNHSGMSGKHHSEETIYKIKHSQVGKPHPKGSLSPRWKGGITPINKIIRRSLDYINWRKSVFERDNWTCRKCGTSKTFLHPHHILNFSKYIELRFCVDNGVTLCKNCHNNFHKLYGGRDNNQQHILEFFKRNTEFTTLSTC
jgi:hypothetical protein